MHLPYPTLQRLAAILSQFDSKSRVAVLGHVYFSLGQQITITASDLEISLMWPLAPAQGRMEEGDLPGSFSCSIAWLLRILKTLPKDGHLSLRLEPANGGKISAYPSRGPSSLSQADSLPLKDAPCFTTAGYTRGGWLALETVRAAKATLPFISEDPTRYVLNGVLVEPDGTVVATNGRFLAHTRTPGTTLPAPCIFPPALVKLFDACYPEASTRAAHRVPVWVKAGEEHPCSLLTNLDGVFVTSTLIDGNFPNWRMVVPDLNLQTTFVTLEKEFREALQHHARSTRDPVNVTLELLVDKTVRVICHTASGSRLAKPFQAGKWFGRGGFHIACSGAFLLTCLKYSGLDLRLIDECSPLVGGDPGQRQTVLMPMRSTAVKAVAA